MRKKAQTSVPDTVLNTGLVDKQETGRLHGVKPFMNGSERISLALGRSCGSGASNFLIIVIASMPCSRGI